MAQYAIIFDNITIDLVLAHRRWSRIKRIRTALRSIRRFHPTIKFKETRQDSIITVEFETGSMLTQFALTWGPNMPPWRRLS